MRNKNFQVNYQNDAIATKVVVAGGPMTKMLEPATRMVASTTILLANAIRVVSSMIRPPATVVGTTAFIKEPLA